MRGIAIILCLLGCTSSPQPATPAVRVAPPPSQAPHTSEPASTRGTPRFDVNGDRFADLALSLSAHPNDSSRNVYLLRGASDGLTAEPQWIEEPDDEEGAFAAVIAMASDINGDGFDDLLVGSPERGRFVGGCNEARGALHLYLGGVAGLHADPKRWVPGPMEAGRFAAVVSAGSDINGDGHGDVLVVPHGVTRGLCTSQKVLAQDQPEQQIFHGGMNGLTRVRTVVPIRFADGELAPWIPSAAFVPDTDRDGRPDLIVLANNDATGSFLYAVSLVDGVNARRVTSPTRSRMAYGYAGAGDVNGDHQTDIIVVDAPYTTQPPLIAKLRATSSAAYHQPNARGNHVAWLTRYTVVCDVNADGFSDFMIGDRAEARVRAFVGSRAGFAASPSSTLQGDVDSNFGHSLYCDDYNGDGIADLVVLGKGTLHLYSGSITGWPAVAQVRALPR